MASTEPVDLDQPATASEIIPVLEERLRIDKRQVLSGLAKVHVTVSERDETIETLLTRQDVVVDRVPIGSFVNEAPAIRQEGDTIIVPVFEERLVVEKRLFLTEELRIRVDERQQVTKHTVNLRREHADIDLQQPVAAEPTKETTA